MNESIYTDDGAFVGYCYVHQGRRVLEEGQDGCQHPTCVAYREKEFQPTAMFNIARLKNQNQIGQTTREMEREIIDKAKEEGRDIQRPTF